MRCQTWASVLRVRGREPLVELSQRPFEAFCETSGNTFLLLGPSFGIAIKPHLAIVGFHDSVQVNLVVGAGLDGGGQFGIEKTGALAADHQILVAVLPQPSDVVLGGNACIHHHQGVPGRPQSLQHRPKRLVFVGIARKHFGAAHEARTVQHQPQGEQRAVGALLFRVPPPGLGLVCGLAFEERVGEVVQRHRVTQAEQLRHPIEQVILDGLAMGHQIIRDSGTDTRCSTAAENQRHAPLNPSP